MDAAPEFRDFSIGKSPRKLGLLIIQRCEIFSRRVLAIPILSFSVELLDYFINKIKKTAFVSLFVPAQTNLRVLSLHPLPGKSTLDSQKNVFHSFFSFISSFVIICYLFFQKLDCIFGVLQIVFPFILGEFSI